MAQSNPILVVAFDIGTTYSGYAFSFQHEFAANKLKITGNKMWRDGDSHMRASYKTPTSVLIDPEHQFHSFGYEAERTYAELPTDQIRKKWLLFRRFKMNLYQAEISDSMEIESLSGQRFNALSVFSMCIQYLKGHFNSSFEQSVNETEIQYVLTLPAIWDEDAKQFMRKAAIKAGIPSEQLTMALEPEAASIFCQAVLGGNQTDGATSNVDDISASGTRYIVVDAGGGTVDTTVHEVVNYGELKELHTASGGGWGGTRVDEEFADLLVKIFTPKVMHEFCKAHPSDRLELDKEFEINKKRVSCDNNTPGTFSIAASLREVFEHHNGGCLQELVSQSRLSGDVRVIGDKIRISGKIMQSMMRPTVENMVAHVRALVEDPKCFGVSHILLVGGFAESPFLQETFRREFIDLTVVTPLDAVLCVVKGAVMYGHAPETVSARLSAFTYGVDSCTEFKEGKHDPRKKTVIEGETYCDDIFNKFLTIDEEVTFGMETEEQGFLPLHTGQTSMSFCVFKSTDRNPMYTTDPSCTELGSFRVLMPDLTGEKDRKVRVKFILGGTELRVKAHEKTTGKIYDTNFNFVTN